MTMFHRLYLLTAFQNNLTALPLFGLVTLFPMASLIVMPAHRMLLVVLFLAPMARLMLLLPVPPCIIVLPTSFLLMAYLPLVIHLLKGCILLQANLPQILLQFVLLGLMVLPTSFLLMASLLLTIYLLKGCTLLQAILPQFPLQVILLVLMVIAPTTSPWSCLAAVRCTSMPGFTVTRIGLAASRQPLLVRSPLELPSARC